MLCHPDADTIKIFTTLMARSATNIDRLLPPPFLSIPSNVSLELVHCNDGDFKNPNSEFILGERLVDVDWQYNLQCLIYLANINTTNLLNILKSEAKITDFKILYYNQIIAKLSQKIPTTSILSISLAIFIKKHIENVTPKDWLIMQFILDVVCRCIHAYTGTYIESPTELTHTQSVERMSHVKIKTVHSSYVALMTRFAKDEKEKTATPTAFEQMQTCTDKVFEALFVAMKAQEIVVIKAKPQLETVTVIVPEKEKPSVDPAKIESKQVVLAAAAEPSETKPIGNFCNVM